MDEIIEEPLNVDMDHETIPLAPSAGHTVVTSPKETEPEKVKLVRLPLARVKQIMKLDSDCELISKDALMLITKSTEMFIEFLSKESVKYMIAGKRKTVQRKDVDAAIDSVPSLCFLDGAFE